MKRAQSTHLAGHILPLLANSPELNPVENLWQLTRDNWLSNRVFKSYEDIVEHCCYAWRAMQERKICPSADWRIARMNVLSISCVSLNVARHNCGNTMLRRISCYGLHLWPTRITRLPKFSPRRSPMKASGAFSSPSMISSRYLILPLSIQAAISLVNSG